MSYNTQISKVSSLRLLLQDIQKLSLQVSHHLDPLLFLSNDQLISQRLLHPKVLTDINRLTNLYDTLGSSIEQVAEQLDSRD